MTAVAEEEVVFVSASSGSTGVPTLSPFTKKDFEEFQDVQSRLFWAAGMRPNDVMFMPSISHYLWEVRTL